MIDPAIESELEELEAFVQESDRLAGRDTTEDTEP